jgi:ABC-type multidrug transport system fused ATPase/permease subunit
MPEATAAGGRDPLQQMIIDELKALRTEQSAGFNSVRAEFNARLDRLVTTEAFTAEQRRVDERFSNLGQDIVDERIARVAEFEKANDRMAKLAANVRWVASALLLPIGLFVAGLVLGRGA